MVCEWSAYPIVPLPPLMALTTPEVPWAASPAGSGHSSTDLAYEIDRTTTEAGAYPVMLVSYLIGCVEYADADAAALVKGFFGTAISEAGQEAAAAAAGSAPISASLAEQSQAAVDAIK